MTDQSPTQLAAVDAPTFVHYEVVDLRLPDGGCLSSSTVHSAGWNSGFWKCDGQWWELHQHHQYRRQAVPCTHATYFLNTLLLNSYAGSAPPKAPIGLTCSCTPLS